jgi:nucleoside-triphosphatase
MASGCKRPINALISGPIGIGKTTVCLRVIEAARQAGLVVGGILTPAILDENGVKSGIAIVDLATGERRLLARIGEYPQGLRLGKYTFDPETLTWGCDILRRERDADLLVIDEIGRLELEQNGGFVCALDILAERNARRSLTIVREALLPALRARLPQLSFAEFWVNEENRSALPAEIIAYLLAD